MKNGPPSSGRSGTFRVAVHRMDGCRSFIGRSEQRPYGTLLRQHVWAKKAGASSRTPQNRGEAPFGVRRLAAAFAGHKKIERAGGTPACPGRRALPFAKPLKVNSFGIHEKPRRL